MEEISSYWWEMDVKPGKLGIAGEEIGEENVIDIRAWHIDKWSMRVS